MVIIKMSAVNVILGSLSEHLNEIRFLCDVGKSTKEIDFYIKHVCANIEVNKMVLWNLLPNMSKHYTLSCDIEFLISLLVHPAIVGPNINKYKNFLDKYFKTSGNGIYFTVNGVSDITYVAESFAQKQFVQQLQIIERSPKVGAETLANLVLRLFSRVRGSIEHLKYFLSENSIIDTAPTTKCVLTTLAVLWSAHNEYREASSLVTITGITTPSLRPGRSFEENNGAQLEEKRKSMFKPTCIVRPMGEAEMSFDDLETDKPDVVTLTTDSRTSGIKLKKKFSIGSE